MPSQSIRIPNDHPAFAGHFPGHPLLPGVVLLAEALEAVRANASARELLGDAPRVGIAKFLSPVLPGETLQIDWETAGARVRFEVQVVPAAGTSTPSRLAATGHFERGTPGG
jgi:3-hydroxyacyl-[acyl-carrier-protein] dehydratase